MSNVVDLNVTKNLETRITEAILRVPGRTHREVVSALLTALGDFMESIECPSCRAYAIGEVVRTVASFKCVLSTMRSSRHSDES